MKNHKIMKSYSCTLCENAFPTFEQLKIHIRTHTVEKPFACPSCDESFTQSGDLESHTGVKSYVCSICDNAFLRYGQTSDKGDQSIPVPASASAVALE